MARGSKKKYTSKQKRRASKIERGYKKRGVSSKERFGFGLAMRRTLNSKQFGAHKSITKFAIDPRPSQ